MLLVDDEPLARAGLRAILDAQEGITVVCEAADGVSVVGEVKRLRPDVIAMDVRMPLMDGIEATRTVLRAIPDPPKILIITTFETTTTSTRRCAPAPTDSCSNALAPPRSRTRYAPSHKAIRCSIRPPSGRWRRAAETTAHARNWSAPTSRNEKWRSCA
ncbi:response regulator [Nocardia australiensis]|uniref:response regulator n=1 Tax=Nocardia australiensis TaxID=2887191 RepID=UPI0027DEBD8B|nr:response regulator transcription factor [Nocardia australiensis]